MKFAKLEQMARNLSPEETQDSLRSLLNDNRFAAVVRMIVDHKETYVDHGSAQSMANSHGSMAHANGSVYALKLLLGQIKQFCEPPKKRGAQEPEKT